MSSRASHVVLVGLLMSGVSAATAWADGLIVVHPWVPPGEIRPVPMPVPRPTPLHVRYHRVEAEITDSVAITRIDQVFYNPNPRQLEGTYIFPLADDVAIQKFSMVMDGKEVRGELLDRDKAREIYQGIVNKNRDPALLEYMGTRMYRARVFPIPASGEVRIQLEYSQTIESVGGLATYRYPLNTEKFSSAPLGDVSVRVRIRSQLPLAAVFCPSHQASIDRKSPNEATVGYEEKNVKPDKDFLVGYQTSTDEFGLALLTYRGAGEDGYFMARIVPSFGQERTPLPKDLTFVIDTSGSMAGTKIEQARQALRFCLANLNAEDRFSIIAFSTEVRPWRDRLLRASRENVAEAREYAAGLSAVGGTNINDALLTALKQGETAGKDGGRPYMIVFLTDGLPTIGERDVQKILKNVRQANAGRVRLFVFGVGSDLNTQLLDKLADDNHGSRQYVSEQEDLELKLSSFYAMIAHPVLSDVKLSFGGAEAYDLYPHDLPDLFKGSELVVFGRCRGTGEQAVVLRGRRAEAEVVFKWTRDFGRRQLGHDYLPRLWANRKIAYLLDEIRMNGENAELKDEIVRLAKRYGILTPYTSFLVMEEAELRGVTVNDRMQAGERV
ncbi:MAG: VWA domain-containing protein, partial [Planctomycetes bacterium]|nr:VWA domain-containing protein [Planctomycetota bacterium]